MKRKTTLASTANDVCRNIAFFNAMLVTIQFVSVSVCSLRFCTVVLRRILVAIYSCIFAI